MTASKLITQCPNCQRKYQIRAEVAGKRFLCQDCGTAFLAVDSAPAASHPLAIDAAVPIPTVPVQSRQPAKAVPAVRAAATAAPAPQPAPSIQSGSMIDALFSAEFAPGPTAGADVFASSGRRRSPIDRRAVYWAGGMAGLVAVAGGGYFLIASLIAVVNDERDPDAPASLSRLFPSRETTPAAGAPANGNAPGNSPAGSFTPAFPAFANVPPAGMPPGNAAPAGGSTTAAAPVATTEFQSAARQCIATLNSLDDLLDQQQTVEGLRAIRADMTNRQVSADAALHQAGVVAAQGLTPADHQALPQLDRDMAAERRRFNQQLAHIRGLDPTLAWQPLTENNGFSQFVSPHEKLILESVETWRQMAALFSGVTPDNAAALTEESRLMVVRNKNCADQLYNVRISGQFNAGDQKVMTRVTHEREVAQNQTVSQLFRLKALSAKHPSVLDFLLKTGIQASPGSAPLAERHWPDDEVLPAGLIIPQQPPAKRPRRHLR